MWVWFTQLFQREARRHGVWKDIDRVTERWFDQPSADVWKLIESPQNMMGRYHYRRLGGGSFRAIGRRVEFGDEQVFVFLRVLHRNSNECERFYDDVNGWGDRHLEPLIDADSAAIQEWLDEDAGGEPVRRPPPLPEALWGWLEPVEAGPLGAVDALIYESEHWVATFREIRQHYWVLYARAIEKYLIGGECEEVPGYEKAVFFGDNEYHVLAVDFVLPPEAEGLEEQRILFLVTPFANTATKDRLAMAERQLEKIWPANGDLPRLREQARRSYPDHIILDDDAWLAIEQDAEANLALSFEERQILEPLGQRLGAVRLPLFVNGQAGSGKSTMLAHVFASYCHHRFQHPFDEASGDDPYPECRADLPALAGHPLYLTENNLLLESAKESVRRLLQSSARYLLRDQGVAGELEEEQGSEEHAQRIAQQIQPFFRAFRELNWSMLGPEGRARFAEERRVTFSRFRRLFLNRPTSDEDKPHTMKIPRPGGVTPELAWYVIRTFIKGMRVEGELQPEEYGELPAGDRQIPLGLYELVFRTVWSSWYKNRCVEGSLWDDQDIVRHLLSRSGDLPMTFPVIFCDEAQDFTRIDLRLILELSAYSGYDAVSAHGRPRPDRVPFMFVGDPLQTINPTGFRWASLKDTFREEVTEGLNPLHEPTDLEATFRQLTKNYRSIPSVVDRLNLIQAWRAALFEIDQLSPQEAWGLETRKIAPRIYDMEADLTIDDIPVDDRNMIIIIPTDDGSELDYIAQDPELSQLLQLDPEASEVPDNIFTPIGAKGLEFDQVLLYKFGDFADPAMWRQAGGDPDRRSIDYEDFFNKLYVAASRAKRRLLVLDTTRGIEDFWEPLNDTEMLYLTRFGDRWEGHVQPFERGTKQTLAERSEDERRRIADELFSKGRQVGKPDLLRRARNYYIELGMANRAELADAWALWHDRRWTDAASIFLEQQDVHQARECFWRAHNWHELSSQGQMLGCAGEYEFIPEFMLAAADDGTALNRVIDKIATWLHDGNRPVLNGSQWTQFVDVLAERSQAMAAGVLRDREWNALGQVLERLAHYGFKELDGAAGQGFLRGRDYAMAEKALRRAGHTDSIDYAIAKSETTRPPGQLRWLLDAKKPERVIELCDEYGTPPPEWLPYLARAMRDVGATERAVSIYCMIRELDVAMDLIAAASKRKAPWVRAALDGLIPALCDVGQWEDALRQLDLHERVGGDALRSRQHAVHLLRQRGQAVSTEAVRDGVDTMQQIDRLLERYFVNSSAWRQQLSFAQAAWLVETNVDQLVIALRFFEGIMSSSGRNRKSARRRWIACKKKQANFHRSRNDTDRAESLHREAVARAASWGENHESIPMKPEAPRWGNEATSRGTGLTVPEGATVQRNQARPSRTVVSYGDFEIRIDTRRSTTEIEDMNSYTTLRCQLEDVKVMALEGDEPVVATEGTQLTFDHAAMKIRGSINGVGDKAVLRVSFGEGRGELTIDFAQLRRDVAK